MRSFILLLVFIFIFSFGIFGMSISASADGGEKPFMVIRFSNTLVSYEQSLYKAIKLALAAKSSVVFDVVAVTPEIADKVASQQNEKDARFFAQQVVARIGKSGVAKENITLDQKIDTSLTTNEVQIFVR
jgi:uncharacterized protein YpiB (UPF0302 family)